jgi:hypothetical protein
MSYFFQNKIKYLNSNLAVKVFILIIFKFKL